MRKITASILLLLFLCGFRQDDYYARLDMLIGATVGMMAQTTALPIVAGADTHLALADTSRSFAWETFINSRKRTAIYAARQLTAVINGQAGVGQAKQFMDIRSGTQYAEQDMRLAREALYTIYFSDQGTIAEYIDRITVPQAVLEAAFAVELPELPDPDAPGFDKKMQTIQLRPGAQEIKNDSLLDTEVQVRVGLEIISGNYTVRGKRIVSIPENTSVRVGVSIKGVENAREPYALLLSVPETDVRGFEFMEMRPKVNSPRKLSFAVQNFPAFDPEREPLVVQYIVPEGIGTVTLTIKSTQGKTVYEVTEPVPDPKNPIPFVWSAENIAQGDYVLHLSAHDKDKDLESEPAVVRVTDTHATQTFQAKRISYNPQGQYYGFLELRNNSSEHNGVTKLFVWLQGTENTQKKPISASLYFSNAQFDVQRSELTAPAQARMDVNIPISVILKSEDNQPIVNAHVKLYSNRNTETRIDTIRPEDAQTDMSGCAQFILRSAVPGEIGLYAQSDLVWVNARPVIVKITSSQEGL